MHLEIVNTKSENLYILEGFQQSIIPFINIYNQIYLTLNKPISLVSKVKKETDHEFGFIFPIDGEIHGKSICLIDTFNKELDSTQKESLLNASQEGLNILIGRTLGALDKNTDLMSLIAPPQNICLKTHFSIKEKYDLKINLTYNIEFQDRVYHCRIYFLLNKSHFRQVHL